MNDLLTPSFAQPGSEWLAGFLAWLRAEGCTLHWIECCRNRLGAVEAFLDRFGLAPARLAEPEIQGRLWQWYQEWRTDFRPGTLHHLRGAVRYFLRYARETGRLPVQSDPDWVDAFPAWMLERGYAANSVVCYTGKLRTVAATLASWGWELTRLVEPETQAQVLRHWQDSHGWGPLPRPYARTQLLGAIRCWIRWAREHGLVPPAPPKLPRPPRPRAETRPFKTRPWLIPFGNFLREQGYRRYTLGAHLGRMVKVGHYLKERGLEPAQLSDPTIRAGCLASTRESSRKRTASAIDRWLAYARTVGLIPPPHSQSPATPPLVEDFLRFSREHRGLSPSTMQWYRKMLTELAGFVSDRHPDLVAIPLALLDQFVAMARASRIEVARAANAVRSFLRYLFLIGLEPHDRSRLVEAPRMYRNERLPRHLSESKFQSIWTHVDRNSAHGKKVWALLILLSTYGLRIGEAARLRLEDLNLDEGWLRVARTKTGAESSYPVTPAVEQALRQYLEIRPHSMHPELFLTTQAPYRPYRSKSSLGACVRTVLARVMGGPGPGQGPHTLRFTLARRLREGGVSLGLMRQILGHRHSNSTGRYLRVSLDELREVAQNYADLL